MAWSPFRGLVVADRVARGCGSLSTFRPGGGESGGRAGAAGSHRNRAARHAVSTSGAAPGGSVPRDSSAIRGAKEHPRDRSGPLSDLADALLLHESQMNHAELSLREPLH